MKRGLLKDYAAYFTYLNKFLDVFVVIFSAYISFFIRYHHLNLGFKYLFVILLAAILVFFLFPMARIYSSMRNAEIGVIFTRVLVAWVFILLLLTLLAFLTKSGAVFSARWFVVWCAIAFIFFIAYRLLLAVVAKLLRMRGFNQKFIVVLGEEKLFDDIKESLHQHSWLGYKVIQYFPLKTSDVEDVSVQNFQGVNENQVDEVWVALPLSKEKLIQKLLYQLRNSSKPVRLIPGVFNSYLFQYPLNQIGSVLALNINSSPFEGVNRVVKNAEDFTMSLLLLIVLSPLLLLIAILVKVTSKGPALFVQKRHGLRDRQINVYKFRTMYLHDDSQVKQARKNDSRITPLGRFLRRTSLDELPQLINVLQGNMSLVGPRPHAVEHNYHYRELIDSYMQRHRVKPGMTGWAQINGLRGETDTIDKMKRRVEADMYYIENWSLWLDFKIIFLTVFKGFSNKNAY